MAGMGAYLAQLVLNVSLKNTASIVSPGSVGLGLALTAPTSVSMFEVGSLSGYTPQACGIGSVGAAGTQASNSASCSFGPFTAAGSYVITGVVVKDTLALGASNGNVGNLLYFGMLSAARTVTSGDSLIVAAGALTITLA
jgi:hypothetical protein